MYELTPDSLKTRKGIIKGCTSFVIRNKLGHIFHGRNLDYGLEDHIPGLYGIGEFYKNGKLIYYGEIIAGYLGFNTGMAPGRFSISLNSRVHPENSRFNVINGKYLPIAYQIRRVLETASNYENAVKELETRPFPSYCYLIIGGMKDNEGVVLSRSQTGVDEKLTLTDKRWYVIITNWDRGENEPITDIRRTTGILRLEALGQDKANEKNTLNRVLRQYPNFNFATISTTYMSASTNYYNATVWTKEP
jgi:hypothetical protein